MQSHRLQLTSALVAVALLAGALRSCRIADDALTNDEAYSWRIARYPWLEVISRTRWDANPPLHYLLLRVWGNAFGDSPVALRSLSVVLGILAIPTTYVACREAQRFLVQQDLGPQSCVGPVFATFLVAISPVQVVTGQTARMYGLGVLLTALTSWLLFRAMQSSTRKATWWSGYGVGIAALAYTHYYGFFVLAAHAVFAIMILVSRYRNSESLNVAVWLLFAILVGTILYSPWLSVFRDQIGDVREGFATPSRGPDHLSCVFWRWYTGVLDPGVSEKMMWLGIAVLSLAVSVWKRSIPSVFFLLQVAIPWSLGLLISLVWHRSVLEDRYLCFAQWALLCYWGIALPALPSKVLSVFLAMVICSSAAWGTISLSTREHTSVFEKAIQLVQSSHEPGDEVWVTSPTEVNQFRYYASRHSLFDLPIRCPYTEGQKGHVYHLAALNEDDFIKPASSIKPPRRIWQALTPGERERIVEGTSKVLEIIVKSRDDRLVLVLYQREAAHKKAGQ